MVCFVYSDGKRYKTEVFFLHLPIADNITPMFFLFILSANATHPMFLFKMFCDGKRYKTIVFFIPMANAIKPFVPYCDGRHNTTNDCFLLFRWHTI